MKKLKKLITIIGLSIALPGCAIHSNDFIKEGEYNGFYVKAIKEGDRKKLLVFPSKEESKSFIYSEDIEGDGRFDKLELENVPKGHKLERFIDINELEKAYDHVSK